MDLTLRVSTQAGPTVIELSRATYKSFQCTVTREEREYHSGIPSAALVELYQAIEEARITPHGQCAMGVDGVSYELTIEDGVARSTYRWWMEPSEGWRPLARIADRLLQLGTTVSGLYLP